MNTAQITATHQRLTRLWHVQPPGRAALPGKGLMAAVEENHRHNFLIWHEEDLARRDNLPAERIREAKRTIDRPQWCIAKNRRGQWERGVTLCCARRRRVPFLHRPSRTPKPTVLSSHVKFRITLSTVAGDMAPATPDAG